MRKILLIFLIFLNLNALNLKEIILSSQDAELASIKQFEALKPELKRKSVKSGYLPSISLGGVYQHSLFDRFIITPKIYNQIHAKIELLLYDGGAREANLNALLNLQNSENLKADEFKNYIALQCVRAYFTALATQEIIKTKQSEKEYLNSVLKRLTVLKNAGLSATDEYESILAKYHLSVSEELMLKQNLNKSLNSLKLLSNLDINELSNDSLNEPDFNKKTQKIELEALNLETLATKEAIREAWAGYLPKLFLKDTFSYYKSKFDYAPSGKLAVLNAYKNEFLNEKFQKNNELILGFEWRIFDFGAIDKKRQIAIINHTQSLLNLNYKKRENEINLKNLKDDIEILKQKIEANKLYVRSAKTSLEATSKKFKAGLTGHSEFLLALAQSFLAQSDLSIAKSELEIKKAEYFFESGEPILQRIKE